MIAPEAQVFIKGKFPKEVGIEEDELLKEWRWWNTGFTENNTIQNRHVHWLPMLLEQKIFLIGTFNNDFFLKVALIKSQPKLPWN